MLTVVVELAVREDRIEEFLEGIRINARASLRDEPGCLRFEVHRRLDDPRRFVLYEIYADSDAFHVAHRSAPHYRAWQEVAQGCIEEGGHVNVFATPAFPDDIPLSAGKADAGGTS